MGVDMSGQVAEYRGLVAATAQKVAASPAAKRAGAEYDDLEQEGLIAVWQALLNGTNPALVIENRMKDYVRNWGRGGLTEHGLVVPLEVAEEFAGR